MQGGTETPVVVPNEWMSRQCHSHTVCLQAPHAVRLKLFRSVCVCVRVSAWPTLLSIFLFCCSGATSLCGWLAGGEVLRQSESFSCVCVCVCHLSLCINRECRWFKSL